MKDGVAEIHKVNGTDNPADLFTKHLSRELIVKNMSRLGFRLLDEKNNEIGCKDLRQEINQEEDDEDEEYHEEVDQWIKHVNHIYIMFPPCAHCSRRGKPRSKIMDLHLLFQNPHW